MYKCKKCGASSELRKPRMTVIEYKPAVSPKQILREIPVCAACKPKEDCSDPSLAPAPVNTL